MKSALAAVLACANCSGLQPWACTDMQSSKPANKSMMTGEGVLFFRLFCFR
jgi:hypothetical protein